MTETQTSPLEDVYIYQLERSLEFARKGGDQPKIMAALMEYGQALLKEGDAPKALTQFEEALTDAEQQNDPLLQARLWGYKGMALKNIGNSDQARGAFMKSNRFARKAEHPILICDSLIRLGMLFAETGEVTKGISKLEQAFGMAIQEKDDLRKMNIAQILGNYFTGLQSSDKALEYYADGLEAAKQLGDKRALCSFSMSIANVQMFEEIFDVAAENYAKALDLAVEVQDASAQVSALIGLTRTSTYLDKQRIALKYAEQALNMAREILQPRCGNVRVAGIGGCFVQV